MHWRSRAASPATVIPVPIRAVSSICLVASSIASSPRWARRSPRACRCLGTTTASLPFLAPGRPPSWSATTSLTIWTERKGRSSARTPITGKRGEVRPASSSAQTTGRSRASSSRRGHATTAPVARRRGEPGSPVKTGPRTMATSSRSTRDPEYDPSKTPIRGMGFFSHEAVGIDSATSIAYLTEDDFRGAVTTNPEDERPGASRTSFLYRYRPNTHPVKPGDLPEDPHADARYKDVARFNRLEGAHFAGGHSGSTTP